MNVSVSPVRLVFNVDSITAVAVSSNWLYLTGGPLTVVRINLDSPSRVEDIQLPSKHVTSGDFIRHLFPDATGRSLLAVTSRKEHFFYSDSKREFKHLGKLRGTTTISASFLNPHWFLMGTEAGNLVEVGVDSSANETYFKRELRLASQVWKSPARDAISGVFVSNREVIASCGSEVLRWRSGSKPLSVSDLADSVFKTMLSSAPDVQFRAERSIKQMVRSPDGKTLGVALGQNLVAFRRTSGEWEEVDVGSTVKFLAASNHYLLAVTSEKDSAQADPTYSVKTINTYTKQVVKATPIYTSRPLRGVSMDPEFGTFWLFSASDLFEIKLSDEEAGIWKVLTDLSRFEEALQVTNSKAAKSAILRKYGQHELEQGNVKHGAKLLGSSDVPLESAALDVMNKKPDETVELLNARLAITKSKAQQIMLTSWLAQLGDYSFLNKNQISWDPTTVLQILKEQGDSEKYLAVAINIGDIKAAVSHNIANEQWLDALDLLRQYEPAELVYDYASVLLNKASKPTVESWMRMSNLDASRLLPSLISYSSDYRGPLEANQALRYVRHLFRFNHGKAQAAVSGTVPSVALFNAMVSMLSMHAGDEEVLAFLKEFASSYNEHEFALRMCLKQRLHKSAVFLYTHMGLYEDGVQICLDIGTPDMYEIAIDIASNQTTAATQGNEELRKYLLRKIAQQVIRSQGPNAAIQFIRLLRVDDLLSQFPEFDTLSDLAPEIVKSLEQTNNKLSTLSLEIDETLDSSEQMQRELAGFKRRSVLVEPGEPCFICEFPLVTRKFVVFPCQHGFHMDCALRKLGEFGSAKGVTDECVLCSNENLQQIDAPLTAEF